VTNGEAPAGWGPAAGQPTTTLLLRHGETAMSTERRFAGRGDVPLTKEGCQQARQAARAIGRGAIDLIVSSPLQRARRTAEQVAETTGAAVAVDDALIEADFGAWEGLTFAEVAERWPDELATWMANPDATPPGGESFAVVARRVLAGLDRYLNEHNHQRLLLVSHVTPIKTLICRALLAPPAALFRMNIDVTSLSLIDWYDDGPALVRSINDTSHVRRHVGRLAKRK
jgi:broad specificity phosphatase PhoE